MDREIIGGAGASRFAPGADLTESDGAASQEPLAQVRTKLRWRQRPPKRVMTIRSSVDVEAIMRSGLLLHAVHAVVKVPHVGINQSLQWERGLNESFHECGCRLSALCVAIVLGVSISCAIVNLFLATFSWGSFTIYTMALLVLSAIVGKIAAVASARFRIKRIAREMRKAEVSPYLPLDHAINLTLH